MSTCHGMWSVGSMIGASSTSILIGLGIDGPPHIIILGILLFIFVLTRIPVLLSIREETVSDVLFSLPSGPLIGLALISFCVMLGEGAIADWSAVYLQNTLSANAFYTGMGYAGFSLSMAIGRFYGDRIIATVGTRVLVMVGSLTGIVGLSVGLFIQEPLAVVLGFTFAGIGFSCLVPALYSSASRTPGRVSGASIAAVAGLGYFGMFIGPPLIGFVAEAYGLTIGLSIVILLLGFSLFLSMRTRFHN